MGWVNRQVKCLAGQAHPDLLALKEGNRVSVGCRTRQFCYPEGELVGVARRSLKVVRDATKYGVRVFEQQKKVLKLE